MKKKPSKKPVVPPPPEVVQFNLPVTKLQIGASSGRYFVRIRFGDPAGVTGRNPEADWEYVSFHVPFHPRAVSEASCVGSALCALAWITDKSVEITDLEGSIMRVTGTMRAGKFSVNGVGHAVLERWLLQGKYPEDMPYPYGHGIR